MFKRILNFSLVFCLLLSVSPVYAAADVITGSMAWSRNKIDHTDIGTTGANVDTTFSLAANSDKIEVAVMVRNTGDAASGIITLWRSGDLDGTYVNNTLRKYQTGAWTDLNASWNDFNTEGTKLNLGVIPVDDYIRVVYQIDVGAGHIYGDLLQDYIKIYSGGGLVKTLSVSTYVPYVAIQSANSGDDGIVIKSVVELLESAAETIGNFEVSKNGGGSFTTLAGPSTATYSVADRTITLAQSQVDFNSGENIVVRMSNLKTADNLRFLNPSNFTTAGNLTTDAFSAVDTTAPTFTAGFDPIAGGDGILFLTFNEPMNTTTLTSATALARTSFNNGHDLGTTPTVSWTSTSTAKIVLDGDGDVVAGDSVTLNAAITDANGNAVNGGAVVISTITLDAPTITAFTVADQTSASATYTNSTTVNVTAFTATDTDGVVSGYLINENAATPALASISNLVAPATYTITGGEGARTLYAWVKDDDDHITGDTAVITLDLTNPVVTANVADGTYNSTQTVTLSFSAETNPNKIYYTLDGSVPDNLDTEYTVPLSINSNTTLKLIGYDLAGNASAVVTRTYAFACNPATVSNGSVAAYPGCAISCNAGYSVSGSSCVSSSSGGGGGGGGGGSASVDTKTIYNLPALVSDKPIQTYRPIRLSGSEFTRPVSQINYYTEAQADFALGNQVTDLAGNPLSGTVLYPIEKTKAETVKTELRVPNPGQSLLYASYYQFGSLEEKFSPAVTLTIPVTSSVTKYAPTTYNIYQWVPAETGGSVGADGVVYRAGNWVLMGDGTILDENGVLKFTTTYSTLIAFTSKNGTTDGTTSFTDIAGHWAKTYIEALYAKGIVSGKSAGVFAPDDNLTRAELTKIALNSFPASGTASVALTEKPFSDVEINDWFASYVQRAKEAGILAGYADGSFRPNQPINRAEALKILLEASDVDLSGYTATFLDTDPNAWYAPYLAYAKTKGIVEGYETQVTGLAILSGSTKVPVIEIYEWERSLGRGDSGEDVKDLQEVLLLLGFYQSGVTGNFDALTESALIQFQLQKGIITSSLAGGAGKFGPTTNALLSQEKIESKFQFTTETQFYFRPEQSITRAEIAKIAMMLIGE